MRYEMMLPHQIRTAIDQNWPVVLPLGVLEYHGEHLAVGLDTLIVVKSVETLESEMNLVLLPPFYYGAASHAVAPPERNGSVHVDADALYPFARQMFKGLLRVGFRNIHFFIHHQSENFAAGMPTDLAFKLGARQAIFDVLETDRGEGWWGREDMADYYARQSLASDPFSWIQGHPLMPPDIIARFPFDHAAKGETSLLMALFPEAVEMGRLTEDQWYTQSARDASVALGEMGRRLILENMRAILAPPA
jgi:creatinine amidohydrolase/Fe(II)-dependent formamide hydrolase-like protein